MSEDPREKTEYAEVWLKQTNKRIDIDYDYLIPDQFKGKIKPGIRVVVPFGKGNRALEGFVSNVKDASDFSEKTRAILTVIDDEPVVTASQIKLCEWMHRYYCSLYYEALAPFVTPVRVIKKKSGEKQESSDFGFKVYHPRGKAKKNDFSPERQMISEMDFSTKPCDERNQTLSEKILKASKPVFFLSDDLEMRFDVYLHIAEEVLLSGGQSVILFPDVFSANHFKEKVFLQFGHQCAFCSGELAQPERYDVFKGVQSEQISIVFGTRSALFLPYRNLSVIMIDEPDDSGYFARSMPKYDTVEVAKKYSRLCGSKLILGGPELPLSIYYQMSKSEIIFFEAEKNHVPTVQMIDMQSELRRGNPDFISNQLKGCMEETIHCHKKVLLMLNRLGYAGYLLCRNCGHVEKCPNCGISMKPYLDGQIHCRYCGHSKRIPQKCPLCASSGFKAVGMGVEKAAEILQFRYPSWRIIQIDARCFSDKEGYQKTRERIEKGEWDLIIGTRALMKGFSYENVGLSAALLMDEAFNRGDYNDSEKACLLYRRFFALSEKYAIGQTFDPENDAIYGIKDKKTEVYLESELQYRKLMQYPPVCHLVLISLIEKNHNQVKSDGRLLFRKLKQSLLAFSFQCFFHIFEPVLAGIQPKTGNIRYKIMIKTARIEDFHQLMNHLILAGEIEKLKSRVSIEVDPGETI